MTVMSSLNGQFNNLELLYFYSRRQKLTGRRRTICLGEKYEL